MDLEQKALQLQMNPHFIFNALNSIQSLVSTQDFKTARQEINHFASLMRIILSNSRKQKISLQEEITTLGKYLRMEQFCQRVDFTFAIHPPGGIDPEEVVDSAHVDPAFCRECSDSRNFTFNRKRKN